MATVTMKAPAPGGLSNKARELMEAINTDAGKHNIWVRTQANSPAQKPWFSETTGEGSGQLASGRVAVNQMKTVPFMWKWNEYNGYLKQISEIASKADVSPIEFADRQSILLLNPGLNGRLQVTNTIRCAISIYNPGDVAPVHLHSPNASRTILSKNGGYTVVEGEKVTANYGDLILTPNGTWHDHGNDSGEPVIWIDTLDWPLMEFLDAAWVDHNMPGAQGNTNVQAVTVAEGYSRHLYSHGGIKPTFVDHQRGVGHAPAPLFHYRGADVLEMLHSLRKEKGDPYEGIKVDFVNPVTGEPVFKTLNYSAQLLRPGEETEWKRETAGTYYVCIEGSGTTEVGGKRFEWGHNDLFVVPNFLWRRHINTGKTDAVIYSVSDAALMKQYRPVLRARPRQGRRSDGTGAALNRGPDMQSERGETVLRFFVGGLQLAIAACRPRACSPTETSSGLCHASPWHSPDRCKISKSPSCRRTRRHRRTAGRNAALVCANVQRSQRHSPRSAFFSPLRRLCDQAPFRLVALAVVAAALLDPFQAAIAVAGLVGFVLIEAGQHAGLAGGILGIFGIDRAWEHGIADGDWRGSRRCGAVPEPVRPRRRQGPAPRRRARPLPCRIAPCGSHSTSCR